MRIETRADGRKVCPFDHHTAEYGQNYREINKQLRAEGPVWTENYGGFWVVTDYDTTQAVMLDPETFTMNPVDGASQFGPMIPQPEGIREMGETPGMFFFVDGERHDAPRAALARPFSKRRVAAKSDMIMSHVDGVLDRFLPKGEFDIVHDVSMSIVAGVVTTMVGLELQDPAAIFRALVGPTELTRDTSATGDSDHVVMSLPEALEYVDEVVQARKKDPRDDVISILLQDGQFSDAEVQGIVMQILMAALENPQSLTAHTMLYLAARPELREQLRTNPDQIPDFLVEGMRNFNPATTTARTATRDVDLAGIRISKGDRLLLHIAAANADPAKFDNPDEFDPERRGYQHLSFGAGVHNCLGSHVVMAVVAATVQRLLERVEEYSFTEDDVARNVDRSSNDMFETARMRIVALREHGARLVAS
ncbi:cytochrome P450 (plasmid) [Arthrobacter sp. Z1-9]